MTSLYNWQNNVCQSRVRVVIKLIAQLLITCIFATTALSGDKNYVSYIYSGSQVNVGPFKYVFVAKHGFPHLKQFIEKPYEIVENAHVASCSLNPDKYRNDQNLIKVEGNDGRGQIVQLIYLYSKISVMAKGYKVAVSDKDVGIVMLRTHKPTESTKPDSQGTYTDFVDPNDFSTAEAARGNVVVGLNKGQLEVYKTSESPTSGTATDVNCRPHLLELKKDKVTVLGKSVVNTVATLTSDRVIGIANSKSGRDALVKYFDERKDTLWVKINWDSSGKTDRKSCVVNGHNIEAARTTTKNSSKASYSGGYHRDYYTEYETRLYLNGKDLGVFCRDSDYEDNTYSHASHRYATWNANDAGKAICKLPPPFTDSGDWIQYGLVR